MIWLALAIYLIGALQLLNRLALKGEVTDVGVVIFVLVGWVFGGWIE